jgi:hypothetical protein
MVYGNQSFQWLKQFIFCVSCESASIRSANATTLPKQIAAAIGDGRRRSNQYSEMRQRKKETMDEKWPDSTRIGNRLARQKVIEDDSIQYH